MSENTRFMSKMRYINEIMGCACFPDLLELKVFPNAKEITESSAVFNYLRYKKLFAFDDPDVTFVCVGDGSTPRTAARVAFRTSWNCISVDPEMNFENNGRVRRLECIKSKVEDVSGGHYKKLVIAHVHSHAKIDETLKKFSGDEMVVVSMPCCVRQFISGKEPTETVVDKSVWSPKNKLVVWAT